MNGFEQNQSFPSITDIIIGRTDSKKYYVKSILMTTYTFETAEITKLLTGLAANGLCTISRLPDIAVYYHEMTSDSSRITDCGSFVRLGNKMEGKAFHPKIALLRLGKKAENTREAAEENTPENKYLLIVSSRNITRSAHLEAYAVLEGAEVPNAQNNGKELLEFIQRLNKIAEIKDPQDWSCLEAVDFRAVKHPNASVHFVTAETLGEELNQLSDIIVVSPFLGKEIQGYKIGTILSTEDALKSIMQVVDCSKLTCRYFSEDDDIPPLHAKIYCGLDHEENTVLIIGSSNATFRGGLAKAGSDVNCEFNVKFCLKGKEKYDEFKKIITEQLDADDDLSGVEQSAEEKKENLMSSFTEFSNGLNITALENNMATFSGTLPDGSNCKFSINGVKIDSSPFSVNVELSNFFSAEVKVALEKTGNSQSFYLDLLSICGEPSICDALKQKQQDSVKANRKKYSEMCIESIINGKKPAKALEESETKKNSAENGSNSSRAVSRDYIFEKLMKLARLSGGSKDDFAEKLRQINSLSVEGTEWAKVSAEFLAKAKAESAQKGEQE